MTALSPYPLVHEFCGTVVLYHCRAIEPGEVIHAHEVVGVNGERYADGDRVRCPKCGPTRPIGFLIAGWKRSTD